MSTRLRDVQRFYDILGELERKLGGTRALTNATGAMRWPRRGVYFFFEADELRSSSGSGPRVVRVGTHAITAGNTTLWDRLRQHRGSLRGTQPDGGNHRGSIFRLHVGTALLRRNPEHWPSTVAASWGVGQNATADVRLAEYPLEQAVSHYIRAMPLLWLAIEDAPGPDNRRGYIEANLIALLSNYSATTPIDPPSSGWLGRWADREAVRRSGLWNVNHVEAQYDPAFLNRLSELVD